MGWLQDFKEYVAPANEDDAMWMNFIAPNPAAGDVLVGGNFFGKGPGPDGPPPGPGPGSDTLVTAMPSLTDSDRRTAARKTRADLLRRGGRASTILTEDPLGGGF